MPIVVIDTRKGKIGGAKGHLLLNSVFKVIRPGQN